MIRLIEIIIAAVAAFAATNIDDIIILLIFFAQVDTNFRRRHIIVGQYLGFFAIIIASLPGFFGGLILEKKWIGLLGLMPIIIGVSRLINRQGDDSEVQTVSAEFNSSSGSTSKISIVTSVLSLQTYKVATVTFANGGDNIGIYVPLFANSDLVRLLITLSIFFVMVGIWCSLAYLFTLHPAIANILTRQVKHFVPLILIALGIYIIVDSGSYQLLPQFKSAVASQ